MITILSFRDLVRLFFIFRREFKWAFLATVIIALLGAFLLPSRYHSEARLLVKPGRDNATVPIELSDRQTFAAPGAQRDPTIDEEKTLTSRPIVHQVAEYYLNELANAPPPKSLWKRFKNGVGSVINTVIEQVRAILVFFGLSEPQTAVERLVTKLGKNFSVSHEAGAAVMEIEFTWDDPAIAQTIVENWIRIYQQERLKTLSGNDLYTFYEDESKKTNTLIDEYKAEITQLQKKVNTADVQQRILSLTQRLDTLKTQSFDATAELNSLTQGVISVNNQIAALPNEVTTEREFSLNPTQLDLKNRLNELQLKRVNDLRTYVETSPQIKALDESIAQLKQQIEKEPTQLQRQENQAPNILITQLKQNLIEKTIRISELTTLVNDQHQQMKTLTQELDDILAIEPRAAYLQRQLTLLEKSSALYADSLEKSRIDSALDKNRFSNIAIIETATYTPGRIFPKPIPILLASIPGGLLVGLLVIYLCSLLDLRIHDGGRVEKVFRTPLWTTLADLGQLDNDNDNTMFKVNLYHIYNLLSQAQLQATGITLALTSSHRGEGVTFIIQQLQQTLLNRGQQVRIGNHKSVDVIEPAKPGEVVLLDCGCMHNDQTAFLLLPLADLIVLVVEARKTTIPSVKNSIDLLTTAFKKVDGIIINRRQFEIPQSLLQRFNQWRGA
jgi:hypothetical protein